MLLGVKLFDAVFLKVCRSTGGHSGKCGQGSKLYNKTVFVGVGNSSFVLVYVEQKSLNRKLQKA